MDFFPIRVDFSNEEMMEKMEKRNYRIPLP